MQQICMRYIAIYCNSVSCFVHENKNIHIKYVRNITEIINANVYFYTFKSLDEF